MCVTQICAKNPQSRINKPVYLGNNDMNTNFGVALCHGNRAEINCSVETAIDSSCLARSQ
jgi:hypothetical protein